MKNTPFILLLLFSILLALSACSTAAVNQNATLATFAPESELTITPSKTLVLEFENKNKGFTSGYDNDECYNITPDFIADNSDYEVFKYAQSCESFIMYDDEVYSIGICFGGYGITSMALADLNEDGQYELYYTFSWGSGIPRSQIGYFDSATKKATVFDDSVLYIDIMLTMSENGKLSIYSVSDIEGSFVEFSTKADYLMGSIVFEDNNITAKLDKHKGQNETYGFIRDINNVLIFQNRGYTHEDRTHRYVC